MKNHEIINHILSLLIIEINGTSKQLDAVKGKGCGTEKAGARGYIGACEYMFFRVNELKKYLIKAEEL